MNLSSLNLEKSSLVDHDGVPTDWHQDITFSGITRSKRMKAYVVRLTVAGSQLFIGQAYSQTIAARLYDLALWKFAAKFLRPMHVNFPDEFPHITQEVIDRDCPRLNELYQTTPFLRLADEQVEESELRHARIANGFIAPNDFKSATTRNVYTTILLRHKRRRVEVTDLFTGVERDRLRLKLNKLPDLESKFREVETVLAAASKKLLALEGAMESQQEYYERLQHETTI